MAERSIPVVFMHDGNHIACDVCGPLIPATKVRLVTVTRELAYYCDDCARRYIGWPERAQDLK